MSCNDDWQEVQKFDIAHTYYDSSRIDDLGIPSVIASTVIVELEYNISTQTRDAIIVPAWSPEFIHTPLFKISLGVQGWGICDINQLINLPLLRFLK